jgi:hypothetical protein
MKIINIVNLDVTGETIAQSQSGLYITHIEEKTNTNIDKEETEIINVYQTMLNTRVTLSSTDSSSSITYTITLHNGYDVAYEFVDVSCILGETTYSNENIEFKLTGLEEGTIIYSNSYITFDITYQYKDGLSDNNSLTSYLTFNFKQAQIIFVQYVDMGYSMTLSANKVDYYDSITASNFVFELNEIVLPDRNLSTANVTKTYNASTGSLTIKRSAVAGYGTVKFKGNLYAIPKLMKEISTTSGNVTLTFDCTGVEDYQNKKAKDFVYDITQVAIPSAITGTTTFAKKYDPTTGILTITREVISSDTEITYKATLYTVEE